MHSCCNCFHEVYIRQTSIILCLRIKTCWLTAFGRLSEQFLHPRKRQFHAHVYKGGRYKFRSLCFTRNIENQSHCRAENIAHNFEKKNISPTLWKLCINKKSCLSYNTPNVRLRTTHKLAKSLSLFFSYIYMRYCF